jgi:hypothetical protein
LHDYFFQRVVLNSWRGFSSRRCGLDSPRHTRFQNTFSRSFLLDDGSLDGRRIRPG